MAFTLTVVEEAEHIIEQLQHRDQRNYRKVVKCLAVWESYVEQDTPAAWRVWWYYGPAKGEITVVDLAPHP